MKQMAVRPLIKLPDGRTIEEADVQPFSHRVIAAGEMAGWALLTFGALYLAAHVVAAFL